jgi:hypothetical protein
MENPAPLYKLAGEVGYRRPTGIAKLVPRNALVLIEFERFNSGDVKGTITAAVRYHCVPNDVRRHRLISISYISLLPCH